MGLAQFGRVAAWTGAIAIGAASFSYASPILLTRVESPSPAAAAAARVRSTAAPGTVVLFDAGTRPPVDALLTGHVTMSLEDGLKALSAKPGTGLLLFDDGGTREPEAEVFAWPMSDAYGKLTRNVMRQITLDPVRPEERYEPIEGVFALERNEKEEWRWLAPRAVLRLPSLGRRMVRLNFDLSPDAPYESNAIRVNGMALDVTRTGTSIEVPYARSIEIRAERSFRPAEALGNQDARTVAVQLTDLEQH